MLHINTYNSSSTKGPTFKFAVAIDGYYNNMQTEN